MMRQGATVTVDLSAIIQNWQRLQALHGGRDTAAVVKADAYGLGAASVSTALYGAGCRVFFVATLEEAIVLRQTLQHATIYVLQGLLHGEEQDYEAYALRPVLNTIKQLQRWTPIEGRLAAALHIDTGMQRLGLSYLSLNDEVMQYIQQAHIDMLMTHYACASEYHHPFTPLQLGRIEQVRQTLPDMRTSYANSAGHFFPTVYHGDITRPGCSLYGISSGDAPDALMLPVATVTAPILQIRHIDEDTTLGYGATVSVQRGMKIATIAIGYADGIHRRASHRLYAYIGEWRVPLLGRVTMDMLCFDVSSVPDQFLEAETMMTLMDHRQTVDDVAHIYGTIGYEVLTSLGSRIKRNYL